MPTGVTMFVWVKSHLEEGELTAVRSEMTDLFEPKGAYFPCDRALSYLDKHYYKYVPVQGKPGMLLDIGLHHAYYGLGYERGELLLFVEVAEWLEQKFPGCVIFYGDDSTYNMRLFDAAGREKLVTYYNKVGSTPYYCKYPKLSARLRELYDW